jgi:hypothetical protein
MPIKFSTFAGALALLFGTRAAMAQTFNPSEIAVLQNSSRQPTDLARYVYLSNAVPHLTGRMLSMTQQLLACTENELGLYDQAIFGFPLTVSDVPDLQLPTPQQWKAEDAADTIAKAIGDRRLVMINEAHHDAHTRVLTLSLLPKLRAMGFDYFAVEALSDKDPDLAKRGYPIVSSGSEYMHEPLYGEIIREALRLGFKLVPYDIDATDTESREKGQAENIYARVFAKDPAAKLFVHAGFAHIDKGERRLGHVEPMAMNLRELSGIEPFSIDQTQFLERYTERSDAYHQLVESFQPTGPTVLVNRADGTLWTAQKKLYDVNVILPRSVNLKAFGDEGMYGEREGEKSMRIDDPARISYFNPTFNNMLRPNWLTLEGSRLPVPIKVDFCRGNLPCYIEAHYVNESADAVAADRYALLQTFTETRLFLHVGQYRITAFSAAGKVLSEQQITVANR